MPLSLLARTDHELPVMEDDFSLYGRSSIKGASGEHRISVYFRGLETPLQAWIENADVVVGCVAWLTSATVLEALAEKQAVSIVVQKEDFLRPDTAASSADWKRRLRAWYDALPLCPDDLVRDDRLAVSKMNVCQELEIEGIRCVGLGHDGTHPLMHHKFVVFCRIGRRPNPYYPEQIVRYLEPYAVWTGSFNFTANGNNSFENAVVIEHPAVAEAYFREFGQMLAISEPLDWESEWCAPEWREGT